VYSELLNQGASVHATSFGQRPIDMAAHLGYSDVVALLLRYVSAPPAAGFDSPVQIVRRQRKQTNWGCAK
jgi:hypothetical protein